MSDTQTTFGNKCYILGQLWSDYKHDPEFADFVKYNDIGLPLAYCIDKEIIQSTKLAEGFVTETFDILLGSLGISDDGFDDLSDLFLQAGISE